MTEPREPKDVLPRPVRLLLGATGLGVSDRRLREAVAGTVVLVTGASSGVGKATARRLGAAGAPVLLVARRTELLEELRDQIAAEGGTAFVHPCDLADPERAGALAADVLAQHGHVDVVVSNAGISTSHPIEETTLDEWNLNQSILSTGYFLVAREAFKVLRRQDRGGSIVFVASKNGLVGGRNAAAYSSAKALEIHLARCLAEEGGSAGIRLNTVNPDAVLQGSGIWNSAWREERARTYGIPPEQLEEHYRARTTLKVNVFPEDIAEAVLFFASPRSAKSTGNILNVDGGVVASYTR